MQETGQIRILYCVLNWGLGHSTRSVAVIRALLNRGYAVEIASDGGPLELLKKTFHALTFHTLQGYQIFYPTRSVFLNAFTQSWKMFRAINIEQKQVKAILSLRKYDAIVSDNRYGCYHKSIPSILITHQMSNIADTRMMNAPGEMLLNFLFKPFDEIWIPDTPDRTLSGRLTETDLTNTRFVGHLSDMIPSPQPIQYEIAAILSGPEPQRSKLEAEILPQLESWPGPCCLVRGLIKDVPVEVKGNVTIYQYRDRAGVNELLNRSSWIVCRTGYTSLMDLQNVGVRALLIPTPGQPEQLYLGEYLANHPQFTVQQQGSVRIADGIEKLKSRPQMQKPVGDGHPLLSIAIDALDQLIIQKSSLPQQERFTF